MIGAVELFENFESGPDSNSGAAIATVTAGFQINPLHTVRRSHRTLVIFTVRKIEGVAEFVDGLLEKALVLQLGIGRQPIEFLGEAVRRNHGASTRQLGFPENKGEDGDIEIQRGNSKEAPLRRSIALEHGGQNFRGRVLLPSEIECKDGFRLGRKNFARDREFTLESRTEFEQRLRGGWAERE